MAKSQEMSPWATRGLYLLAILLIIWPMVDLLTNLWPMQPGNFRWRYGFAGLLGGFHLTPLFGYVLAMLFAFWQGHARVLRFVGVMGFVACSLLLVIMIMFPLDTLQIRAERDPGVLPAVIAGAIIAEGKHFTTFLALIMLARGSWSTGTRLQEGAAKSQGSSRKSRKGGGIVVGADQIKRTAPGA